MLEREHNNLPLFDPCHDTAVGQLKNILELLNYSGVPTAHVRAKLGAVGALVDWYQNNEVGGMRDILEASILAAASDDFYSRFISPDLTEPMRKLYCAFFFDVEEHMKCPLWIERNVFGPLKRTDDDDKRVTSYIWKVVAYHGGEERLRQAAVSGQMYEEEMMEWLQRMSISAHMRNVLHTVDNNRKLPLEHKAQLVQNSTHIWMSAAENIKAVMNEAKGSSGIGEIAHSEDLVKYLKGVQEDDKVSDKEEYIDIDKYTVEDLQ